MACPARPPKITQYVVESPRQINTEHNKKNNNTDSPNCQVFKILYASKGKTTQFIFEIKH